MAIQQSTFRKSSEEFRKKFERFTISTDVIVGFPTETKEDFEHTLEMIQETRPDIVNLSRYSARSGTKAALMDQVDVSDMVQRSKKLSELVNKISHERNQEWVGWKGDVLFDEISEDTIKGRNYAYKPVFVQEKIDLGQKIKVKITRAAKHGLYGQIAS
ncbi:tRNA-i(6)A37 methylthiotransferase [Candidatus Nitrosotalea sp. TS]|nr:tRNA-i(6)A37 methylthiotransferase [Candidatus Nitrosotalea sp. TS]